MPVMKLRSNSGTARLVVIMGIIVVVLALIIIIPIVRGRSDGALKELDESIETAADRQIKLGFLSTDVAGEYVYDVETKEFLDIKEKKKLEPYGNSSDHRGKLLFISVADDGSATMYWDTP